ncbi:23S rRNA pseudouridine(1911/1915/1917) synthase RluD [Ostreibacterium oceani]|uniref:Pseudouridine synthase n=1 Tax=Ostreibacterium oceani TaxID=2654998 RepID=A0A6N7F1N5_9GAMM|nr:23S rRNA pseudouridine(1911/1915/1917) synthase RluD [Ostreibacterium oceani]MPV86708.1 23S rRNA pseudouridine(1911/1915/1917) synthase RluD [Ostreibacterium oceani]
MPNPKSPLDSTADLSIKETTQGTSQHTAQPIHFIIDASLDNLRFDVALARLLPDLSRSHLQTLIKSGDVQLNQATSTPKQRVHLGDTITGELISKAQCDHTPQSIDLEIIYQDAAVIVINKPAGLVVHPGAGNPDNTLLNALLYHFPECQHVPRAGIVHRLDKDTSGVMVVAKTIEAQFSLVQQLQSRSVKRHYVALVAGQFSGGGTVNARIGRSGNDRLRMAITPGGKEAITHYHILQHFKGLTLIECQLETGRTHQIRVHMAHIRHPIIGDGLYSGRQRIPKGLDAETRERILGFPRQALHARTLAFIHPSTGELMTFETEIPADMSDLIATLPNDQADDTDDALTFADIPLFYEIDEDEDLDNGLDDGDSDDSHDDDGDFDDEIT